VNAAINAVAVSCLILRILYAVASEKANDNGRRL